MNCVESTHVLRIISCDVSGTWCRPFVRLCVFERLSLLVVVSEKYRRCCLLQNGELVMQYGALSVDLRYNVESIVS